MVIRRSSERSVGRQSWRNQGELREIAPREQPRQLGNQAQSGAIGRAQARSHLASSRASLARERRRPSMGSERLLPRMKPGEASGRSVEDQPKTIGR